jgi:hypothetical protein
VDDAFTLLDTTDFEPEMDVWYRIEVERIGDNHVIRIDGVTQLDANDGTFGSGRFGLYTNAMLHMRFDELRVFSQ